MIITIGEQYRIESATNGWHIQIRKDLAWSNLKWSKTLAEAVQALFECRIWAIDDSSDLGDIKKEIDRISGEMQPAVDLLRHIQAASKRMTPEI